MSGAVGVSPMDHQRDPARRGRGHEILIIPARPLGKKDGWLGPRLQDLGGDGEIEDPLDAQLVELLFLLLDHLSHVAGHPLRVLHEKYQISESARIDDPLANNGYPHRFTPRRAPLLE